MDNIELTAEEMFGKLGYAKKKDITNYIVFTKKTEIDSYTIEFTCNTVHFTTLSRRTMKISRKMLKAMYKQVEEMEAKNKIFK